MKLIGILTRTIVPSVCPTCRQQVTVADRADGFGSVTFSGDPAGFKITKNAQGEMVDHFDQAELHGCTN